MSLFILSLFFTTTSDEYGIYSLWWYNNGLELLPRLSLHALFITNLRCFVTIRKVKTVFIEEIMMDDNNKSLGVLFLFCFCFCLFVVVLFYLFFFLIYFGILFICCICIYENRFWKLFSITQIFETIRHSKIEFKSINLMFLLDLELFVNDNSGSKQTFVLSKYIICNIFVC